METLSLYWRMLKLEVRDRNGAAWLPLFGYDNEVVAYAPAPEAVETFIGVWGAAP